MTEFIIDDDGNKTFIHEGWLVRIWSKQSGINTRIDVESPNFNKSIDVRDNGLWVYGELKTGWDGPSPAWVSIPWIVLAAIIDARALVASEEKTNETSI